MTLKYPIKIETAIELVSDLYGQIALDIVNKIINGENLKSNPQDESQATYSLWRDHQDYRIDWHQDAEAISRFIDAVGPPYAGARCFLGDIEIRINDAKVSTDVKIENRQVGKVLFIDNGKPVVVCGKGLLKIVEAVYPDGKNLFPLNYYRLRFK